MLPVESLVDDDYVEDDVEDGLDDYDEEFYSWHGNPNGSVSSLHGLGCQLGLAVVSPKSMRKPCGRVRGLGRNRQTVLSSQNRADFVALELELGSSRNVQGMEAKKKRKVEPWCFPVSIMGILVVLIIFLPFINPDKGDGYKKSPQQCNNTCRLLMVESIPRHLKFPKPSPVLPTIYSSWIDLINSAQYSIDIASFYWDLNNTGPLSAGQGPGYEGQQVFKELAKAGLKRKIKIRIAQSQPESRFPDNDSAILSEMGAAEVRSLNFTYLLGSGVLHTKFWIVDNQSFWIGSANMDWRSLTEVKELGLAGYNCSCIAEDLAKIFAIYWYLGATPTTPIPHSWPPAFSTAFNQFNPLRVPYNGASSLYPVYLASAPPAFCANGRAMDIDALLTVMNLARKTVYISVMDYTPVLQVARGRSYWPVIDDAIRAAAFNRGVTVRLLVSKWNHTNPAMVHHLRSLLAINGVMKGQIEIKWFQVPAFTPVERRIPFSRVNHCKYMVTESAAYIGTSNWEGDYFTVTAGTSIIISDVIPTRPLLPPAPVISSAANFTTVRDQLESVFLRDWNSKYAFNVSFF